MMHASHPGSTAPKTLRTKVGLWRLQQHYLWYPHLSLPKRPKMWTCGQRRSRIMVSWQKSDPVKGWWWCWWVSVDVAARVRDRSTIWHYSTLIIRLNYFEKEYLSHVFVSNRFLILVDSERRLIPQQRDTPDLTTGVVLLSQLHCWPRCSFHPHASTEDQALLICEAMVCDKSWRHTGWNSRSSMQRFKQRISQDSSALLQPWYAW